MISFENNRCHLDKDFLWIASTKAKKGRATFGTRQKKYYHLYHKKKNESCDVKIEFEKQNIFENLRMKIS